MSEKISLPFFGVACRSGAVTSVHREISIRANGGEEIAWIEEPGGELQVLPGREMDALRICIGLLLQQTRRP